MRECAPSERYASPTQIVIPASCPPRNSPFDEGSRNRRGSPPLRSSLDPRPSAAGPKSLSRSLAGYDSPARVRLTPKALFHLAFSRSDRHDRPSASCRLVGMARAQHVRARPQVAGRVLRRAYPAHLLHPRCSSSDCFVRSGPHCAGHAADRFFTHIRRREACATERRCRACYPGHPDGINADHGLFRIISFLR